MDAARRVRWTEDEYLDYERKSASKHEYLQGEIYDMAGAAFRHNVLAMNAGIALARLLRGRPCRVFNSDQRICVSETGLYTYADAGVVCGRARLHPKDQMTLLNPGVLVEVLSSTTADYDRGEKLSHYRRIPSLQHVLLIDPDGMKVAHHHQIEPGTWLSAEHAQATMELRGLGALALEELFDMAGVEEGSADG